MTSDLHQTHRPQATPDARDLPEGHPDDKHGVPEHVHEVVIELGRLKPQLIRGARMFVETVTVPTMLLYILLNTAGLIWGLCAVIGWCALTLGVRRLFGQHLPGTLLLC